MPRPRKQIIPPDRRTKAKRQSKRLSDKDIAQIVLMGEQQRTYKEIQREIGCGQESIARWIKRGRKCKKGELPQRKKNPGRPASVNTAANRKVMLTLRNSRKHFIATKGQFQAEFVAALNKTRVETKQAPIKPCKSTLDCMMKDSGLRSCATTPVPQLQLRECNKKQRKKVAMQRQRWTKKVHFFCHTKTVLP